MDRRASCLISSRLVKGIGTIKWKGGGVVMSSTPQIFRVTGGCGARGAGVVRQEKDFLFKARSKGFLRILLKILNILLNP